MNVFSTGRIALRGLRSNRLRSALTTVGIVIGVAAVVVLAALGNGVQTGFNENFAALTKLCTVNPVRGEQGARPLTDNDVAAVADPEQAPNVALVSPRVTGSALVKGQGDDHRVGITGTTANYVDVVDLEMQTGTFFDTAQERASSKVAVLGAAAARSLFDGDAQRAMGQSLTIGRTSFEVIGVTSSGNVAFLPLGAARSFVLGGAGNVDGILISATSAAEIGAAQEQVTDVLSRRHHIRDPNERDFDVTTEQDTIDRTTQFISFLTLFTGAIAGISLFVGGIGVANIMLVSVTERTREIGLRKAIGATRRDILQQFMMESTALSGFGGVLGVLIGVGISFTAGVALPRAVPDFPSPVISPISVVLALGVSVLIGLVAGGYPAFRAGRLRPIEALRYD